MALLVADQWMPEMTGIEWLVRSRELCPQACLPGVFAAGDVRDRSVKRVASAVGDGAIAISSVHEYLAEG